jgi:hypothetical protein
MFLNEIHNWILGSYLFLIYATSASHGLAEIAGRFAAELSEIVLEGNLAHF